MGQGHEGGTGGDPKIRFQVSAGQLVYLQDFGAVSHGKEQFHAAPVKGLAKRVLQDGFFRIRESRLFLSRFQCYMDKPLDPVKKHLLEFLPAADDPGLRPVMDEEVIRIKIKQLQETLPVPFSDHPGKVLGKRQAVHGAESPDQRDPSLVEMNPGGNIWNP